MVVKKKWINFFRSLIKKPHLGKKLSISTGKSNLDKHLHSSCDSFSVIYQGSAVDGFCVPKQAGFCHDRALYHRILSWMLVHHCLQVISNVPRQDTQSRGTTLFYFNVPIGFLSFSRTFGVIVHQHWQKTFYMFQFVHTKPVQLVR